MMLFLLTRLVVVSRYEAINSMVVRAESESQARHEASKKAMYEGSDVWLSSSDSQCEKISLDMEAQVLCIDTGIVF